MKSLLLKLALLLGIFFITSNVFAADKTVESILVTQVDTFALKGMPDQPILKINIRVTGSSGTLSLQKLIIQTLNQDNTDVDSVSVYYSNFSNRFSLVDYPGEAFLLGTRKKIDGDSVILDNLSHVLETGDNYFWVTMSLNAFSRASHYLDAFIKANQITINAALYPATDISPTSDVTIFDIYFKDNFENPKVNGEPTDWTQDQINSSPVRWKNHDGGFGLGVTGHPDGAVSGNWNVMLQRQETTPRTTILISKPIDLSLSTKPLLSFYHAQETWDKGGGVLHNDELRVLYKIGESGTWNELKKYELPSPLLTWLKREVLLPEGTSVNNLYLGFEGTTKYGYGVCLDSISIYETGIVSREVKSIVISQPITEFVPQGNSQNPIMRVNVRIKGNTGGIQLNSLKVTSANTSDSDIKPLGVKLFYTNDSVFQSPVQYGTAQSFSGGSVTFSGLNKVMETGENYLWVTYDLQENATPGHVIDASINAGDIILSIPGTFPSNSQSPVGSRIIKQSLFFDDFEGANLWDLNGEFQIGPPLGKGGDEGYPDPTAAYSGSNVLGTDLSGNGDYEYNIPANNPYSAKSPLIDGKYFKNLQLDFYRFLNIDNTDSAYIEYQLNTSTEWKKLWVNSRRYVDTKWQKQQAFDLKFLDRKKFFLRFTLGPTDAIDNYSGWNIDYLLVTADSIPYDAAVVAYKNPLSSCDLSASEHVSVYIKNTGPKPLINTPVQLSIDGGKTFINEVISAQINPDDSLEYTFTHASDFSKPSIYNIKVKTVHPGDNYPQNDTLSQNIISYPTYSLPYRTGFENDTTFWFASGRNSSWFEGDPSGSFISTAAEGIKSWKTDAGGYHNLYEYSYVESPCFSFTGKEIPMIDLKFNTFTKDTMNGALLEYSLDQGKTWSYADEDPYPFPWNWYNQNIISLNHKGWTKRTLNTSSQQTWKQGRQLLPNTLANQAKVKFRVAFKSDSSFTAPTDRYEGFAFDDVRIYDAPFDVGVTEFVGLNNPGCQYENDPKLKLAVKNYGYRTMHIGDTIIIGVKVNSLAQITDTFKLTKNFSRNDTLHFKMNKPVNITNAGSYEIKAFTTIENDKTFYGAVSNDTSSMSLTINPNPVLNMVDTIRTAHPDTVILKPHVEANTDYFWQDGSTNTTFAVSDLGDHWVRATNSITGCITQDSTYIKLLVPDAGIASIVSPVTNCGYGIAHHPVIKIKNMGTDTLRKNDSIFVYMNLNAGVYKKDTVLLTKDLAPDSLFQASLTFTFDLSAAGMYNLISFTKMKYDTVARNDTIKTSFQIFGYPHVFLGNDTVVKGKLTHVLDAGPGFVSQKWSDGITTTQNYTVTKPGNYSVTVTDNNNCSSSDTIHVHLVIHDLAMQKIVSPIDACTQTATTAIKGQIKNTGTDTIQTTEPIILSYEVDGAGLQKDTLLLSNMLKPNDSILYTFKNVYNMATPKAYSFKLKASVAGDIQLLNDSLVQTVQVFGNPTINLGIDKIVQALDYKIDPGKFTQYKWQDNSTDSVWVISKTHFATNSTYSVSVTDIHGCTDRDTVAIFLLVNDLEVSEVLLPGTSCSMSNSEVLNVKIKNIGNSTLTNKSVDISYSLNGGPSVQESFIFNGVVGTTMLHTFQLPIDMTTQGKYSFKVTIDMAADVQPLNDSATFVTDVLGFPAVDFGAQNDTIITTIPYTLDAGSGYASYEWQNGSTASTLNITAVNPVRSDTLCSVIVTNDKGCSVIKTVTIIKPKYDLAVTSFSVPQIRCATSSPVPVNVEITNSSSVKITNQPITVTYAINGGTPVSKQETISLAKGAKKTIEIGSGANLSTAGTYTFDVDLAFAMDEDLGNNLHQYQVVVNSNPTLNFGTANDTIKAHIPYSLDAGAGYASYSWQNNTTNRYLNVTSQGFYWVIVTDNNNCSVKDSVYIVDATAIGSLQNEATISLYPNPASEYLYIDIQLLNRKDLMLDVIGPDGKVVMLKKLTNGEEYKEHLDVSVLPKGMYYVRIYTKDSMITQKIVVR